MISRLHLNLNGERSCSIQPFRRKAASFSDGHSHDRFPADCLLGFKARNQRLFAVSASTQFTASPVKNRRHRRDRASSPVI
jgi:hypothetical protein